MPNKVTIRQGGGKIYKSSFEGGYPHMQQVQEQSIRSLQAMQRQRNHRPACDIRMRWIGNQMGGVRWLVQMGSPGEACDFLGAPSSWCGDIQRLRGYSNAVGL